MEKELKPFTIASVVTACLITCLCIAIEFLGFRETDSLTDSYATMAINNLFSGIQPLTEIGGVRVSEDITYNLSNTRTVKHSVNYGDIISNSVRNMVLGFSGADYVMPSDFQDLYNTAKDYIEAAEGLTPDTEFTTYTIPKGSYYLPSGTSKISAVRYFEEDIEITRVIIEYGNELIVLEAHGEEELSASIGEIVRSE